MSYWKRITDSDLWCSVQSVPEIPACYVIYLNREIVYVGQAENIRKRLIQHLVKQRGGWLTRWGSGSVRVKYRKSVRYGDWLMVELRLIRRLQPRGNVRGVRSRQRGWKTDGRFGAAE